MVKYYTVLAYSNRMSNIKIGIQHNDCDDDDVDDDDIR